MNRLLVLSILIVLVLSCNLGDIINGPSNEIPPNEIQDISSSFMLKDHILSGHSIISLTFDSNNDTWFGTRDRELIYCGSEDTVIYNSSNSIISELHYASGIKVDGRGKVWFRNEGLVSLYHGTFTRYTPENSLLPVQDIRGFEIDSQDRVWVISCTYDTGGVVCIDQDELTIYSPENTPLPTSLISDITIDGQDKVWISTMYKMDSVYLASFDQSEWELFKQSDLNIAIPHIASVYTDKNDNLYGIVYQTMSTSSYCDLFGMFYFDKDNENCEFLTGSKSMNEISFFNNHYFDDENRLWCSQGCEISLYDGLDWTAIDTLAEDMSSFEINQFINSPNGDLWVVTDNGVYIYGDE